MTLTPAPPPQRRPRRTPPPPACPTCVLRDIRRTEARALAAKIPPRSMDVLRLTAEGLTRDEIAARLWLSPHTVKSHLTVLHRILGVHRRGALVAAAFRAGVIE